MKKLCVVIVLLLTLFPFTVEAEGYADDFRNSVELEDSLLTENTDLNDPESIKEDLSPKHWVAYLMRQLRNAFSESLNTFIKAISLVLLSVLVNRCSGNLQNQSMRFIFSFIVSISIVLMCESSLRVSSKALQVGIENMSVFTKACIPSFTVVMIAAGEGAGATVFSGSMVLLGEIGTLVSENLLLPLTNVYLAIGICSSVNDEYNFVSIGKNIRKFFMWVVGLLVLGFKTLLKLQGSVAAAGDQLTKKYIRTAVGSFMPMVGNAISNGVDGLFAVASGVKTSFAVGGVLIVLSILFPILLSIGINGLTWGFCKWISDFFEDNTVSVVSDVLSNSFYLMLALGACVTLMGLFSFFGLMVQVV